MSYSLVASTLGGRSLKKLPIGVRNLLIEDIGKLKDNPYIGYSLRGKLSKYYSFHMKLANIQYRAIYEINMRTKEVIIHH